MADTPQAVAVAISNHAQTGVLDIEWDNGRRTRFEHAALRAACRCADCVCDPAQREASFPEVRIVEIRPVGAYGIQLIFSDGHDRGIYPWAYLLSLPNGQ